MREHAGLRTTTRFYAARRVSLQCQVTAKYVQETSPGSLAHGVPMPRPELLAGLARTMVADASRGDLLNLSLILVTLT